MGRSVAAVVLALLVLWPVAAPAAPTLILQELASALPNPVGIENAGDGTNRLFIVLQGGRIVIWDGTEVLPTDFLTRTNWNE